MNTYEFRLYRRTHRVHIFERHEGNAPNMSLCGEVKYGFTIPDRFNHLVQAKIYAMEHSYTCPGCREILAKRSE